MKLATILCLLTVFLTSVCAAGGAQVSRKTAKRTALDLVKGGVVKSSELEKEDGNEVWSFDIASGGLIREIWIDASNGLIVQDRTETPEQEKAEKAKAAADAKAARRLKPVSRQAAEKAALALVEGGVIKEGELEKEGGKLVWSFDILAGGKTREVWIDAVTGKAARNTEESKAEEKAETAADLAPAAPK
ncbi:MAG: PepSY domain-containing protein [Elusimicrobia bacterium]|nr:PepSY domain-containing protein [Elusimicrobiota bacterium]